MTPFLRLERLRFASPLVRPECEVGKGDNPAVAWLQGLPDASDVMISSYDKKVHCAAEDDGSFTWFFAEGTRRLDCNADGQAVWIPVA
jgi:hypothetical protein